MDPKGSLCSAAVSAWRRVLAWNSASVERKKSKSTVKSCEGIMTWNWISGFWEMELEMWKTGARLRFGVLGYLGISTPTSCVPVYIAELVQIFKQTRKSRNKRNSCSWTCHPRTQIQRASWAPALLPPSSSDIPVASALTTCLGSEHCWGSGGSFLEQDVEWAPDKSLEKLPDSPAPVVLEV